jgi:diguanylate cyclase (GGDEF)-like protein
LDFVHPDDADAYGILLGEIARGRIETATTQQRYRHRDGHWVWVEVTFGLYRENGANTPSGYVASVRDISRRKEAEAQLAHMARHDLLTGLPNRLKFQECLQKEVARARRGRTGFALHCLDLDRFKAINDSFGHPAGDRLLQAVADRLRAAVRTEDTIARLGGDEFVIIQTKTDQSGAVTMAERLIASLSAPFDLGAHQGQIGVSIGIVLTDGIAHQGEALHSAADNALYEAKAAGRSTFRLSDMAAARGHSRVA